MKKVFLFVAALTLCLGAAAQSIGKNELKEIQGSFIKDASTVALQNVLSHNTDINTLASNLSNEGKQDTYFKYEVDVKGITNQRSSGRCWLFTSLNELRPVAAEKLNVKEFYFSQNYDSFWDLFEKSNLFLEDIIASAKKEITDIEVVTYLKTPVGDGGVWNLFVDIAEKYGVVPAEVMPETEFSNNTGNLRKILNEKLRDGAWTLRQMAEGGAREKALRKEKIEIMKQVYRILALCLGEPPTEFTWRYKDRSGKVQTLSSTPQEFYAMIAPKDFNMKTMVMIMNDPTREYYKLYEIESYRNTWEGFNWIYLNLPNEDIKPMALASIKDNRPMYISCDVGKYSSRAGGWLDTNLYDYEKLFGIDISMDKKARILTRQSGSSHAMLLIACDTDENDVPLKWKFENSWGPASGQKGYVLLTDEWFDEYLFRIVIDKKYVPANILKMLDQKPVKLPVWDYMF
ncbi:MAG: C1 family peptidase [Bacteroidales bacterium]|nr:C1 family peptidase [Bacteroidales bacterium]